MFIYQQTTVNSLLCLEFQINLISILKVKRAFVSSLTQIDCPTDIAYTTQSEPNSEISRLLWSKFPGSQFTSLATYTHSHCPVNGWSEAGLLPGAHIEATYANNCAVISYRHNNLKSLYISTLIEYGVEKINNAKWLYWALMYLIRK
jgi:hypothetical protein